MAVKICAVRVSETVFYDWLVPEHKRRLREWVELEKSWGEGDPSRITQERVERQARIILERLLSIHKGRIVRVSDRSWACWRKVFVPNWSEICSW